MVAKYFLDGKVAVVTGAGRGIGRAIALRLGREGAAVACVDLSPETAEATAKAVRDEGAEALAISADVSVAEAAERVVRETVQRFGRLDILVNNAGINKVAYLLETNEADWDAIFAVNVKAMWLCSAAAARQMIAQGGGGKIINASSRAGKIASPYPLGAYITTKHAVIGLTRALALELSHHKINVNAYCPGVVDTPMWDEIDRVVSERQGLPRGSAKAQAVAAIPLGRIEQPEDVANLVAFLASDESDYMTGQAINITGGSVMH